MSFNLLKSPKFPSFVPKSVMRKHILHAWMQLTACKIPVRIQKKAMSTLHNAVMQQIKECLRAAKKMILLSTRHVVTAKEIYLARSLLFASIPRQNLRSRLNLRPIANNACRELARSCNISLSRKYSSDPIRPFNSYDEIRLLITDLIYAILQHILHEQTDGNMAIIKLSYVTNALESKSLRKNYMF